MANKQLPLPQPCLQEGMILSSTVVVSEERNSIKDLGNIFVALHASNLDLGLLYSEKK